MTYFICFRLIGDFLLPPSYVLRRSYRELSATMKHIGTEYQAIDAYPKDPIIHHKEHEHVTYFHEFHTSRYQEDQVKK